jgi:uncharacterized membrane protein YdbT with pleckstrin-like domain
MVFDSVYFFLKLMFFRGNPTAVLSVLFLFLAALAGWIIEHKYSGALKYAAVYFCVFYIFVWAYMALRAEKTSYNIYREGIGHTCVFFEKTDKYVDFKDISTVIFKQGLLQKLSGTGTVEIFTDPTDDEKAPNITVRNGRMPFMFYIDKPVIAFESIAGPAEFYERIKDAVYGPDRSAALYTAKPVYTPVSFIGGNVQIFIPAMMFCIIFLIGLYFVSNGGLAFSLLWAIPGLVCAFILYGFIFRLPEYLTTEFRFFRNAAETKKGVFTETRKTVFYRSLPLPQITSDFIQKPFGLSNITFRSGSIAAYQVFDVKNGDKAYNEIVRITSAGKL